MEFVIYITLVLIGVCLGSFGGATVWRLRARQLVADKKNKEPFDHKELHKLEKLTKGKVAADRSRCLHCDYTLRWYDLIPVVSWLALRGKCRHCHKKIGYFEPLIEVGVAAFFVASYAFWPFQLDTSLEMIRFGLWLVAGVALAMLFAYDTKWFLLPDKLTIFVVALGVATVAIAATQSGNPLGTIFSAIGAVGVLSGLYLVLYLVSQGKWVGFGDVKLGLALALLLVDWQSALVALFLANLIGCLIVIPFMATGKLKRSSHVPFGPLMIAGAVIAQFVSPMIVSLYVGTLI